MFDVVVVANDIDLTESTFSVTDARCATYTNSLQSVSLESIAERHTIHLTNKLTNKRNGCCDYHWVRWLRFARYSLLRHSVSTTLRLFYVYFYLRFNFIARARVNINYTFFFLRKYFWIVHLFVRKTLVESQVQNKRWNFRSFFFLNNSVVSANNTYFVRLFIQINLFNNLAGYYSLHYFNFDRKNVETKHPNRRRVIHSIRGAQVPKINI